MSGTALLRAILAGAAAAGCPARLRSADARDWASATFVGAFHRIHLHVPLGDARAAWLAALPEAEWSVRGVIVADIVVERDGDEVTLTVLLIDAC